MARFTVDIVETRVHRIEVVADGVGEAQVAALAAYNAPDYDEPGEFESAYIDYVREEDGTEHVIFP